MNINLDLKTLPTKLTPILDGVKRYLALIFLIFFVGLYAFLVTRINSLASSEPSEDEVAAKLQSVKVPKINQTEVDKIEQLKDQNIEVQALFEQARQNPFAE